MNSEKKVKKSKNNFVELKIGVHLHSLKTTNDT